MTAIKINYVDNQLKYNFRRYLASARDKKHEAENLNVKNYFYNEKVFF